MNEANIILQDLSDTSLCQNPDILLSVLRLDLIHSVISGNKWFKLKYHLAAALAAGFDRILTFGGAYSNHLIATAVAADRFGLKSTGIVRGWHGQAQETPTLEHCRQYGMELIFVSREEYAQKENPLFLQKIIKRIGTAFIIPEGGQSEYGRKGVAEMAGYIPDNATHVCVSVGSGATFAGLSNAIPENQYLLGFAPFKNGAGMKDELQPLIGRTINWDINGAYYFGGFAKTNVVLHEFMAKTQKELALPLDRVYTGKMMWGIQDLISKGYFPKGAQIIAIHTGGLQGNSTV